MKAYVTDATNRDDILASLLSIAPTWEAMRLSFFTVDNIHGMDIKTFKEKELGQICNEFIKELDNIMMKPHLAKAFISACFLRLSDNESEGTASRPYKRTKVSEPNMSCMLTPSPNKHI
jgi:hypothetical protein